MKYFKRKLDDKNRLTIPVEVQSEFASGQAVIAPGFSDYLHLYSKEVWDAQLEQALTGQWKETGTRPAILDEELADLADKLYEGMAETALDQKQGRVTIPNELLAHAGLSNGKEVAAIKMPGGYWRLKKPSI